MNTKALWDVLAPEFEEAVAAMWGVQPHGLHTFDVVGHDISYTIAIVVYPTCRSDSVIEALRPVLSEH